MRPIWVVYAEPTDDYDRNSCYHLTTSIIAEETPKNTAFSLFTFKLGIFAEMIIFRDAIPNVM
jgi:hypothetical protein